MQAPFQARDILSPPEMRVFEAAERIVKTHGLPWRVMAQVSLGEILRSPDVAAFRAVNSKRVDLLLVTQGGQPIAAIEYQGSGHYQGSAPARDAVKKEALRRAGIGYVEIIAGQDARDLERAIARIAACAQPPRAA